MQTRTALMGAACAVAAVFCFSFNDLTVKWLSGDYPLHELTLFRSAIGLVIILTVLLPLMGGVPMLKTKRPVPHIARGLCVVFANGFFFLGLAELGLADAVAIFFVSPLLITVFSVVFLREKVGPRRWFAVMIGLVGVLIMVKPGTSAFTPYALLPMIAAVCYASLHMLTRLIGGTEAALTMTFYIQFTFLLTSIAIGLGIGDGRFDQFDSASLQFLFRSWTVPELADLPFFIVMGVC
ncbi:MAG: DMT family transporter, partial [Pseudomonadota bacterium]